MRSPPTRPKTAEQTDSAAGSAALSSLLRLVAGYFQRMPKMVGAYGATAVPTSRATASAVHMSFMLPLLPEKLR
jgi:hypothetical protein